MASLVSFDVTSSVDLQEVDNAVNQARKEIGQRYDFKGSKSTIELKKTENVIELVADDSYKMDAVWEVLLGRLVRRNVPVKNMKPGDIEPIGGNMVKRKVELQQGIPGDAAKDIAKFIKDRKYKKVTAAIQGDQLRISSPSKDELQAVMRDLRGQDFGVELQFGNYRE
jgi:uncharacterized protein YajQ (UPF0234 family)